MSMNPSSLGQVIASRTLSLDDQRKVMVRMGLPYFVPSDHGGDYCCPYQISGLGQEKIKGSWGVDSVQALYLALMYIYAELIWLAKKEGHQIAWLGSPNLGLPVPDVFKDDNFDDS